MVRINLPGRLRSYNSKNGSNGNTQTGSRNSSPMRALGDGRCLVLKTTVLRVRRKCFLHFISIVLIRCRQEILRQKTRMVPVIRYNEHEAPRSYCVQANYNEVSRSQARRYLPIHSHDYENTESGVEFLA